MYTVLQKATHQHCRAQQLQEGAIDTNSSHAYSLGLRAVLKFLLSSVIKVIMISTVPLYWAIFKNHLRWKNVDSLICIYRHPLRGGYLTKKNVNHKTFGHMGTGNYKVFLCIMKLELIFMSTVIHRTV